MHKKETTGQANSIKIFTTLQLAKYTIGICWVYIIFPLTKVTIEVRSINFKLEMEPLKLNYTLKTILSKLLEFSILLSLKHALQSWERLKLSNFAHYFSSNFRQELAE